MPPRQTNVTSETEREAARLGLARSIAATLSILTMLQRYWRAFLERRLRQSLRANLQDLSDRDLTDIGLTRAEVDYITGRHAVDTLRDGTRHLWDRGVM
jgi:uncharacterized protein YjiS (DUF1127 family)